MIHAAVLLFLPIFSCLIKIKELHNWIKNIYQSKYEAFEWIIFNDAILLQEKR